MKVWAIEPPAGELVDGLRNLDDGYIPPIFLENDGAELLDGKRIVRPTRVDRVDPAVDRRGDLRRHLDRARHWPGRRRPPTSIDSGTIVVVSADGGWKYLSTGAWTDDLDEVVERARHITYF